MFSRIFACTSGDLRGQQSENQTVFIGSPDLSVAPQETGAGALFTAETAPTVEETRSKPLETYGHFPKRAVKAADGDD